MLPLPCMLVCVFVCANCTRDRGCSKHPVFPAPSDKEGGKFSSKTRARRAARMRNYIHRHCERSEAIHLSPCRGMDCFAALAMTGVASIPRDDLALVPMNGLGIDQVAAPATHQKFRAAGADRVVAAGASGRFPVGLFRQ